MSEYVEIVVSVEAQEELRDIKRKIGILTKEEEEEVLVEKTVGALFG